VFLSFPFGRGKFDGEILFLGIRVIKALSQDAIGLHQARDLTRVPLNFRKFPIKTDTNEGGEAQTKSECPTMPFRAIS
jgi:hypothetical protein